MRSAPFALVVLFVTAPAWGQEFCKEGTICPGGQDCIEGTCRPSCTDDGDCGVSETCVIGGCFPFISVRIPLDFGVADDEQQPTCYDDANCNASLRCMGGRCQMLDNAGNPRACTSREEDFDALCPQIGGYECDDGICQGPDCSTDAQCVNAYPISGMICREGRCTNDCTADTDCCATTGICDNRPQDECFSSPGNPDGDFCIRDEVTARLIVYRLAEPDPANARDNIVFFSEGITEDDNLENFRQTSLRNYRWLTTRADMMNALLRSNHNLFILPVRDRAHGLGEGTLVGRLEGPEGTTRHQPGSGSREFFLIQNALAQFAAANGFTPAFGYRARGVYLYDPDCTRATGGSRIVMPYNSGGVPGFDTDPNPTGDHYFVMTHEFGHFLASLFDEYQSDSQSSTDVASTCLFNTVARSEVTGCTVCDGSDDGPWDSTQARWSPYINTSTFPTSANNDSTIGLYEGALQRFDTEALRSQHDCILRQDGRDEFCAACREGLIQGRVFNGVPQMVRLHDLDGNILQPIPAGDGPHRALAIAPGMDQVFLTREAIGGPTLSVIDTKQLTRAGTRNRGLTSALDGAGVPRAIAVDAGMQRIFMEAIDPGDPTDSRLLQYSFITDMTTPITIANLVGLPLVEPLGGAGGQVITYRETPEMMGSPTGEMVLLDLTAAIPAPAFVNPPGDIPRFGRAGLRAPTAQRDFFLADKRTPSDAFCDFGQCQIWMWDPQTEQFSATVLAVTTPAVTEAGVEVATVAQQPDATAAIPGELLIAATDTDVFIWRTADVLAGTTAPAATWAHNMGGAASSVSAIGYVVQTEQIVLGNKTGELRMFEIDGTAATLPSIPALTSEMLVRDIVVSNDGSTYIAAGGFLPSTTNRAGVIIALDLAGAVTGDDRLLLVQPVAAVGLSGPTIVIDEDEGLIYTNAVVDSADGIGPSGTLYRMPILRHAREVFFQPSGC